MDPRPCIIGLDEPEFRYLQSRLPFKIIACETLPRIAVRDGALYAEPPSGYQLLPISSVVFHGIFEDDHDTIAGLALWGGPCLPNAAAMMDCRLKLPCLVKALRFTQFGSPDRGFVSPGIGYLTDIERVAKWGNWHCGENKSRITDGWRAEHASIVERFLDGDAIRVVVIGDKCWQIKLEGDGWLKSIHHASARFMEPDSALVDDTRRVAQGFGLSVAANDYIVTKDGVPHLLEVNHIPNVTRFPQIWDAYSEYVVEWLTRDAERA